MSSSSALARRTVAVLRTGAHPRTALRASGNSLGARPRNGNFPNHVPAIAILVPSRHLGTENHRGNPPSGPPPGFNSEEAKKPLSKEGQAAPKKDGVEAKDAKDGKSATEAKESGKDEGSLTEMASAKEKSMEKSEDKKDDKKLTIWEKVKKEAHHYWDGTKLLAAEVRISSRLAFKMAAGYELSRRESRQLQRTVKDLGRLIPFSVFIIVPLGEALLPLALKLFPNMLPSTYEGQKSKDAKASVLRSTRKEVSGFLRSTLKETGLPLSPTTAQKEEFATFFRKIRSTGEKPTDDDVIKVCQIFRDDLTLDNLSRPQLVSMCRYMNLNTFGTDMMLRYQIRHRMRQIKRDDKAITYEGVDSLSVSELQMACASRGVPTHGVSPARMRTNLQTWLDLRLKENVPSTLLVMSNAYMYSQSGDNNQIEALIGVLSSIPEELFHEIELEVHNAEGAATNKQRLEVLKEQQELIEEENEQDEESKSTGYATPRDVDNIDEKEERQMDASSAGVEKAPSKEMVDAEGELAKSEKRSGAKSESKDSK